MRRRTIAGLIFVLTSMGVSSLAQQPPPPERRRPGFPGRPPLERGMRGAPPGRWWSDPMVAERLQLTEDQQRRIDAVFRQHRLTLIDLSASLRREEAILEDLLASDNRDHEKALAQIDRIANARADLERTNGRMLLGFREVLDQAQWQKLQSGRGPGERKRDHDE